MNPVLSSIETIIRDAVREALPDVTPAELEEGGKVYYMNDKNGTAFDWFVNGHLPAFMIFYNDKENLGAARALVHTDGSIYMYLYADHGRDLVRGIREQLDAGEAELLRLAALLRRLTDDKMIWCPALDSLETDGAPDEETVAEFLAERQYLEPSIRRREMFGMKCVVSKKITEEGWKVGYMLRTEPHDDRDSGWQFFAGDEDDDYVNSAENVELCAVATVASLDSAVIKPLDSPAGSCFVRTSSDEFGEDNGQPAHMEKWK